MSPGIAYALGALLLYGVADFVYKRGAVAGALPHRFLMVQTRFLTPLALLYGISSGTLQGCRTRRGAAGAGQPGPELKPSKRASPQTSLFGAGHNA